MSRSRRRGGEFRLFGDLAGGDSRRLMPKRSGKLLLSTALLVTIALGGWFLFSRAVDPFRTASPLDVPTFIASGKSLQGNTYQLEGEVMASLAWSPSGRLISVGVEGGRKAVPVLLPAALNSFTIQRGQKIRLLVAVEDGGVLRVEKMRNL